MTKQEAIRAIKTARDWLRRGKKTWCKELAREVAGQLDDVLDIMAGKAQFIEEGGTRISKDDALTAVAGAGHYAFAEIDKELGKKFGFITSHLFLGVPWDEPSEQSNMAV